MASFRIRFLPDGRETTVERGQDAPGGRAAGERLRGRDLRRRRDLRQVPRDRPRGRGRGRVHRVPHPRRDPPRLRAGLPGRAAQRPGGRGAARVAPGRLRGHRQGQRAVPRLRASRAAAAAGGARSAGREVLPRPAGADARRSHGRPGAAAARRWPRSGPGRCRWG